MNTPHHSVSLGRDEDGRYLPKGEAGEVRTSLLTFREHETVILLAEGMSNKLIADRLGISDHTAKFHVTNVMKKLGAKTRGHAAAMAVKMGLA